MTLIPADLANVAKQVAQGGQPKATVRTLLSWFGAQRRGGWVVSNIRRSLKAAKLETVPDFSYAYIDGLLSFRSASDHPPDVTQNQGASPQVKVDHQTEVLAEAASQIGIRSPIDPTNRIGRLTSANKPPVYVAPDATIEQAITVMLTNDYSQLPVMTSERDVKGMFSWKSVGTRLALAQECKSVRECMDGHSEVSSDDSLFAAINEIVQNECVLVRDSANKICGIITTSDLSVQFRQLGEPFLLLGEIENHIRELVGGKFTKGELQEVRDPEDSARKIEDVADLTLGEYLRLLEDPKKWGKIGIKIDRQTFVKHLDEIRRIRNDVMHFDPDGIGEDDLTSLRKCVQFLQRLREVGRKSRR